MSVGQNTASVFDLHVYFLVDNEENEKQIIISLGVAIAVVAMALINNGGSTTNFLNNIL